MKNTSFHCNIEDGFDFILSHLQEPVFPRKIMTKSLGYQIEVFNKQEALRYFKSSNYQDCAISAYPSFTSYHGINMTPISFLMVDLGLKEYLTPKLLEKALNKTIDKIRQEEQVGGAGEASIGGNPTVLWTGKGYHVYQPVSGFLLEEYETFYEFTRYVDEDLTSLFIQFAEEYFTGNPTDPLHHPTVKSCLLRVPWTLNAKFTTDKGRTVTTRVKVIQRWDGKRPSIQPLLKHFRTWLIQKRVDDTQETSKQKYIKFNSIIASQNQQSINNKISWIEKGILESTLSDHRKYVIWRILSPYLLNVRKLPKEESYSIIKDWLDKCNKLQGLNFNPKEKIRQNLKGASKGHYPISLEKLKEENKPLYYTIASRFSHNYD